MHEEPILRVEALKKSYKKFPILNDFAIEVRKGEIVGLLGHNGAGKSTAFAIIIGLLSQDSGQIFFKGEEISHLPVHKRAKCGIGLLAQEPSVFQSLSVKENILCVLESMNISKEEMFSRLEKALDEMNITQLASKKGYMLSGGEKRRVEIARALVTNPQLLLLDEPFANIDPITISEVKNLIHMLKNRGISILVTDHNAREIFSTVDRSYIISKGQILASGTSDELINNQTVRTSYLGESFQQTVLLS